MNRGRSVWVILFLERFSNISKLGVGGEMIPGRCMGCGLMRFSALLQTDQVRFTRGCILNGLRRHGIVM